MPMKWETHNPSRPLNEASLEPQLELNHDWAVVTRSAPLFKVTDLNRAEVPRPRLRQQTEVDMERLVKANVPAMSVA